MARIIPESLDRDGAHIVASRIRAYWRARGQFPMVMVEPCYLTASPADKERPIWVVRSNMVNGRPQ